MLSLSSSRFASRKYIQVKIWEVIYIRITTIITPCTETAVLAINVS
jgi:hypothetical protein